MARDYYEVLGIARTATIDEIRRAHRKLAKEFHPDKNKSPDAPKRFLELQEAYDALSDPEKRIQYDQFEHAGPSTNPFGGRASRGQAGGGQSGGTQRGRSDPAHGLVEVVFHTYYGFIVFVIQTEHRFHSPPDDARQALWRLHRFNLVCGMFAYGFLLIPILSYCNYLAQKRSIRQQEEAASLSWQKR